MLSPSKATTQFLGRYFICSEIHTRRGNDGIGLDDGMHTGAIHMTTYEKHGSLKKQDGEPLMLCDRSALDLDVIV